MSAEEFSPGVTTPSRTNPRAGAGSRSAVVRLTHFILCVLGAAGLFVAYQHFKISGQTALSTGSLIAAALGEALAPEFSTYAHGIVANSKALAEALIDRGFELVSGGTDNHLILLDVTTKGLSGKQVATALARAGIVTNANSIPFDPRKPFDPSGVRIGTPAVTTRGLQEDHMAQVAEWMNEVVASAEDDTVADRVRAEVHELMGRFPAPGCRTLTSETV